MNLDPVRGLQAAAQLAHLASIPLRKAKDFIDRGRDVRGAEHRAQLNEIERDRAAAESHRIQRENEQVAIANKQAEAEGQRRLLLQDLAVAVAVNQTAAKGLLTSQQFKEFEGRAAALRALDASSSLSLDEPRRSEGDDEGAPISHSIDV